MHQVRILCIQVYSILNVFFLEPKWCGRIFEHDDDDRERSGWATIYDGASLGQTVNLNDYGPIYVGNDRLSSIQAYGGNELLENFKLKLLEDHGRSWSIENGKSVDSCLRM